MSCEVCMGESGGKEVGVAAVPGAPVSLMWCNECLLHNAVPRFVVETWLFADDDRLRLPSDPPDASAFAEWALSLTVWIDGSYVPLVDAVEVIWRDEVRRRNE